MDGCISKEIFLMVFDDGKTLFNSMHGLSTNLDSSSIQSYNFLKFRIKNKIIIQKVKFRDHKDNTNFFIGF